MLTTISHPPRLQESNLLAFGRAVEVNVRSLDFLRAIETTIDALKAHQESVEAMCALVGKFHELLTSPTAGELGLLDPDLKVEKAFNKVLDVLKEHYDHLAEKRDSARQDHLLTEEDGIESAYTAAMESVHELHHAMADLVLCVGEHDADVEIAEGKASRLYKVEETEELLADLKSDRSQHQPDQRNKIYQPV